MHSVQVIARREQKVFEQSLLSYIEENKDTFVEHHEVKSFDEGPYIEDVGFDSVINDLSEDEHKYMTDNKLSENLLDSLLSLTNFNSQPFLSLTASIEEMVEESKRYDEDPFRYNGVSMSDFL